MGIKFNTTKQEETYINLTEYSIKNIIFNSDKNIKLYPKINDVTNSVIIEGVINFESVHQPLVPKLDDYGDQVLDENDEPVYEEREIDHGQPLGRTTTIVPVNIRFREGEFVTAAVHALNGPPWFETLDTPHDFERRRRN